MKPLSIFIILLLASSCKKSSPVEPEAVQPPIRISIAPYAEYIDSLYLKVWSDSSFQRYGKTIYANGGRRYVSLVANTGDEYYYDSTGYAGFQPKGQLVIIFFDSSLHSLPDTLTQHEWYSRSTTFLFEGYRYTLTFETRLKDTALVALPIGTFYSSVWLDSKSTLSVSSQSNVQQSQLWLAPNIGSVKEFVGYDITLARARVNGRGWGMPYPRVVPMFPLIAFPLAVRMRLLSQPAQRTAVSLEMLSAIPER